MLELDMPGHASSWEVADKSITCNCKDVIQPFNNLTYEYIYSFLKDVFDTIYKPFGFNPIVHLGGDEVNANCFSSDSNVKKLMNEKNWGSKETW